MPYEATVPVHRRLLWPAIVDPERLLGALPNATVDAAGAQGVAGRLKLRLRDQSITFRGVARVVEVVPAALRIAVEVEAAFGRADGSIEGVVEIVLRQAGSGTRVVVSGSVEVMGGGPRFTPQAMDAALQRLVQRWFAALAASSPRAPGSPAGRAQWATAAPEDPAQPPPPDRAVPLAVVRDLPADAAADPGSPVDSPNPTAASPDRGDEPPASAALRLIPSSDGAEQARAEVDPPSSADTESGDGVSDVDDIWSRGSTRAFPPWIALLAGVFAVAFGSLVLLVAILRRRRR